MNRVQKTARTRGTTRWHATCFSFGVALVLRIVLWAVVLLVPGGVLALPLLVAHHARKGPLTESGSAALGRQGLVESLRPPPPSSANAIG